MTAIPPEMRSRVSTKMDDDAERSGSSSASRAKKRRLGDDDEMVSAEKDAVFDNQEREHISVEVEGNMDEEEDEDDDREDSSRIFLVGDDVWESKAFSKWREMNWALFNYNIDDYSFQRLHTNAFKPGEDPRCGKWSYELKMGHCFAYDEHPESSPFPDISKDPSDGARLAIEFYNRENKMGKTMKFESVSKVSFGTRHHEPSGRVYFFTIVATETDFGVEREFQASFFRAHENMNIWYLRAFRETPYVY